MLAQCGHAITKLGVASVFKKRGPMLTAIELRLITLLNLRVLMNAAREQCVSNASKRNQGSYIVAHDDYECYKRLPMGWSVVEC